MKRYVFEVVFLPLRGCEQHLGSLAPVTIFLFVSLFFLLVSFFFFTYMSIAASGCWAASMVTAGRL